ncbi:MAG: dUTP diphosphatase [Candidatus Levybacteria bacterium]|nr:dUTP diphosphatase [Candidatus Levybacteria bacterium]
MKVNIKRIDKTLELPTYKTYGSIGFDLVAREKVVIKPGTLELIPLNLVIDTPHGHGLFLTCRSSMPIKKGLLIPNGLGIIDQDYSGEDDELKLEAFNFTKKKVTVERGERIAQGIFVKIEIAKFKEVKKMKAKSRGGFGSTG